jgi:hypothetical protein
VVAAVLAARGGPGLAGRTGLAALSARPASRAGADE